MHRCRPSIPAAWVVFTGFAIASYLFYERGQRRRAAVCLAMAGRLSTRPAPLPVES